MSVQTVKKGNEKIEESSEKKNLLDNLTGGSFEFSYFGQHITFELVPV